MRWFVMLWLFVGSTLAATTMVRITPVSYDEESGRWYALLGYDAKNRVWNDFIGRSLAHEGAVTAAMRILRSETCGFYHLNLRRNPYTCRCNPCTNNREYVFFVPVDYTPDVQIRCGAAGGGKADFAWVPVEELQACDAHCLMLPTCKRRDAPISWGYAALFRCLWPGVEKGFRSYRDEQYPDVSTDYPVIGDAPVQINANLTWYSIPCSLTFYRRGAPHYELSTSYHSPFYLDGAVWPTVDHYMQAMKFEGERDVQEAIRCLATAEEAIAAGNCLNPDIRGTPRSDWACVESAYLLRANRAKFQSMPRLCHVLKQTKRRVLVYDTRTAPTIDNHWGAGRLGTGDNVLGQILMQVRYELHHNPYSCAPFEAQPLSTFAQGIYAAPKSLIETTCRCH